MKNKLIDLHNALFVELETLQDEELFKKNDGSPDHKAMEMACLRAGKVTEIADTIISVNRLQLDAVRMAQNSGFPVEMPEVLGLEHYSGKNKR